MAIDISKILTISASEYVESKSRKLSDYEYLGVQGIHLGWSDIKEFSDEVPETAEVVVGYSVNLSGMYQMHRGTALIPKSGLEDEVE